MPPPQGTPNPLEGPGDYTFTKTIHSDTYDAIDPTKVDHTGHAVLITGASRGIGRAIALAFARAGASFIAVTARTAPTGLVRDLADAAQAAGRSVAPRVLPLAMEITDEDEVRSAAESLEAEWGGRLDVVVCNAGVLGTPGRIADSEPDEWWRVLEVNLRGSYLVTRTMLPLLLRTAERGDGGLGTVVNVASVGALLARPALSAYHISKMALLRLAEQVCSEYGDRGVVAYCIHPGNIPTDIVGGLDGLSDDLKPAFVDTPELSAHTIAFLTSEKRDWLGGRYINCFWDVPELLAKKDEIVRGDMLRMKLVIQ